MKRDSLDNIAEMLHELGLSYDEATDLLCEVKEGLRSTKGLLGKPGGKRNSLIKISLTLLASPDPPLIGADILAAFLFFLG